NRETASDLVPGQPNFHWKPQAIQARFRPARIMWEQTVLPLAVARCRLDLLFNPGFTASAWSPCPQVTVFHDLQHKRHPEYFRALDLLFWRLLLWQSARCSNALIADSQATRADLVHFYGMEPARVTVVPLGVEDRFFKLRRDCVEPFLLCVSTLHPHKNLDRLVRAYARKKRDFRLVIAGMRGFHADALEALVARLDAGDSVRLTGWIPREELYRFYERAQACIFPSTFEGFGIRVLEAMAAGVPLACSDIPPLREIADGAALMFDPLSEEALEEALERIMTEETLRARLTEAGPARARQF